MRPGHHQLSTSDRERVFTLSGGLSAYRGVEKGHLDGHPSRLGGYRLGPEVSYI